MNHPPPAPLRNDNLDPAFGLDFGSGLRDFHPNMGDALFSPDSSLNFERDFAAWFDPESQHENRGDRVTVNGHSTSPSRSPSPEAYRHSE